MGERCYKCQGLVVQSYDVALRCEELICVNCGARPHWKPVRADGQEVGDPMVCRECGLHPRSKIYSHQGGEREIGLCHGCRIAYLTKRRKADLKDGAHGNVRYKGALLV
jgi:hypothetical protein